MGGATGSCPPRRQSRLFCLAYAVHFCSKTNKIYTKCMHFQGVFMPKKPFASGAAPRRQTSLHEVHVRFWVSVLIFGLWELVRLL